jgi:gliding motility-associated-like protein
MEAQCNQQYNWTTWQNFSGIAASGTIKNNGQTINVSMVSNINFGSSAAIFNYAVFNGFDATLPDATVPQTTWAAGAGAIITLCFDQVVENPVLLISPLGSAATPATLQFSRPYWSIFNGGGMMYDNDTAVTGIKGFTELLFPGKFTCLSIYSNTAVSNMNLTWGIKPPLFPVNITGLADNCDSVTLTASGGLVYSWNGGNAPIGAVNTFYNSGTYFVNVRDGNGCGVITGKTIVVRPPALSIIDTSICEGGAVAGYTSQGTYSDHFIAASGCDSIRTLVLTVNHATISTVNLSVCEGDSVEGHTTAGSYSSTSTGANGCDSTRILHLTVVKKSDPYLGQTQQICTGDSIGLYPGLFDAYLWQNGSTQSHLVVKQAGKYTVSVKDACGTGAAEIIITEMSCVINAPNAFSPNGDGINDNWMIPFLYNYPDCKVAVFNRYGQRVFYSKGYNQPWNGTYNGKPLLTGTYYWIITLSPGKAPLHGSVTIIL